MQFTSKPNISVAIIGAGPAGLTAAYLLGKSGSARVDVFEKDPLYVGGISRTETYKGYFFDIGGHRFFSKSREVEDFWTEILEDDLLTRPRSSRIFYNRKFFSYPLRAGEALNKLGIAEALLCIASYLMARLFPVKNPQNFQDWVSNHFGKRLFRIFFKTYTEKVWGVDCREISADWAAQRIKGLSLSSAIKNAILPRKGKDETVIKTLIDQFRYPKFGPGQMWETCRQKAEALGVRVHLNHAVQNICLNYGKWDISVATGEVYQGYDYVISSSPISQLSQALGSLAGSAFKKAAGSLQYRDFITVILILKDKEQFNDNWVYIHDPSVKVGRIQNFKSWSPYMVPDDSMVCYGLEYFCFDGDDLWNSSDKELASLAIAELAAIGLGSAADITDTYVVRQPKAYPVYDHHYQQHLQVIKSELEQLPGLILCGRNGMHKYNNQDHSMMTAMLAVKNILAGSQLFDLWKVNQDAEYHEDEQLQKGGRLVPQTINPQKPHLLRSQL